MTSEEYREGVLRTESGRFDAQNIRGSELVDVFQMFIASAKAMDAVKRALYYGKELNWQKLDAAVNDVAHATRMFWADRVAREGAAFDEETGEMRIINGVPGFTETPSVDPKIAHAAIGLATESGEIIEKVLEGFRTMKPFDYANLFEELGDIAWYEALAIDSAGKIDPQSLNAAFANTTSGLPHDMSKMRFWSHEAIWQKNIAKLQARYPGKFNTEDAFERDLDKEKEALGG